jgi:UDP-glucose 4-epimerase
MNVLVTGGAGFVGSHLVERVIKEYRTIVIDDLSNGSLTNLRDVRSQIKIMRADVSKESTFRKVGKVDGIFHLACHPRSFSFSRPTRDVDVNVRGTVNVLEISRKSDAKLVFTSNSGIYGDPKYLPMDEDHPIDCKTPYDVNKYASELQIRAYQKQYNLPVVVCRLATVFGPRQKVNEKLGWRPVVATFLELIADGRPPTIFGDGEQTRDLIYVKDVADGLVRAFKADEANGHVFNLSTEVETSVNSTFNMLCTLLGRDIEPIRGPPSIGDIRRMCCSNAKARKMFNFDIKYPLRDALKEYVAWYKSIKTTGK